MKKNSFVQEHALNHLSKYAIVLLVLLCIAPRLLAQDTNESGIELEIGPAGEWSLAGDRPNFGASVTGEATLLPDWLELEIGFSGLVTTGDPELEAEFLFEKPFLLSGKVEFSLEVGPSLSREFQAGDVTSLNLECEAKISFWPHKNLGWYLESGWSDTPKNGEQSISGGIGVLVPIEGD